MTGSHFTVYLCVEFLRLLKVYLTFIVTLLSGQEWNGTYFADVTLQQLGLEVHLGHNGHRCPYSHESINDFTIVDISGIHTVTLRLCACPNAPHARTQLLMSSLLPASLDRPQSAFTFDVLDTFQLLNLQGKISAYDFYYSLDHKTDNTRTQSIQVYMI
jgi:CxC2 like cysteine cluster associated with KDZ transposases